MENPFEFHEEDTIIACVGDNGGTTDEDIRNGFKRTVELLTESLKTGSEVEDLLVYPIVYNARHSIELSLKIVIKMLWRIEEKKGICYSEEVLKERKKELLFKNKSKKDSLTNLYNRESAVKIIEGILKDSQYKESIHALMIMDFDNFKTINDSLGHIMGDKVLIDAAAKLRKALRKSDIIARLGGDEILIFLLDIGNKENVARVASQIVAKMRDSYEKDEKKVETSVSIGIAISPTDGRKFTELYEKADIAMYEVKKSGRNGYHIYLE